MAFGKNIKLKKSKGEAILNRALKRITSEEKWKKILGNQTLKNKIGVGENIKFKKLIHPCFIQ